MSRKMVNFERIRIPSSTCIANLRHLLPFFLFLFLFLFLFTSSFYFFPSFKEQYMQHLLNIFSPAKSNMPLKTKTPPAPTVPTAIKAKEELKLGEGGKSIWIAWMKDEVEDTQGWSIRYRLVTLRSCRWIVETAYFANGCFVSTAIRLGEFFQLLTEHHWLWPSRSLQWGTEHFFRQYYSHLPQFTATSGYTGGHDDSPCTFPDLLIPSIPKVFLHTWPYPLNGVQLTSSMAFTIPLLFPSLPISKHPAYRAVCTGKTGHAETVKVTYQTGSVAYAELVEFFYRTHDSTTVDQQGPDRGSRESYILDSFLFWLLLL